MKIMICFDNSKAAHKALTIAHLQAEFINPTIYVATSIEKGLEKDLGYIRNLEKDLKTAKGRFDVEKIPCETHILYHNQTPGEDLIQFAEQNKVDMIFIGVKKTSRVDKMLFGSTALHVIMEASCPVLTVK